MSSEIETTKEEGEDAKETKKTLRQRLQENWQIGLKILEILLCIICLSFIIEPVKTTGLGKSHLHHVGVMYTAYTGYMLINGVILLARYMGDHLPYKTSTIFSICGASMFLLTGTLLIADRSHLTKHYFYHPTAYLMEMLTTSTIFAFITAIVFAVDAVFTFRRQNDL